MAPSAWVPPGRKPEGNEWDTYAAPQRVPVMTYEQAVAQAMLKAWEPLAIRFGSPTRYSDKYFLLAIRRLRVRAGLMP